MAIVSKGEVRIPSFKEWILQFLEEDTPRGDATRDILLDKCFPNPTLGDGDRILEHLCIMGACATAQDVILDLYEDYLDQMCKEFNIICP